MTYTFRAPGEQVFAMSDQAGCGKVWPVQEAGDGSTTVHVCSRPDGHGGDLHRCKEGCWWRGPVDVRIGDMQYETRSYLIWSLSRKKWMGPEFRGYVDQVEGAGRFSIADARRACTQHTTPMTMWAGTRAFASSAPLPAIHVAESAVMELAHNGATLQKVIETAASQQILGWREYWAEEGKVYQVA